jgi:hypothetical protein
VGKICFCLMGVLVSSCAFGATVTFTLSLNENAAGQCAPNSFAIFASVSQGDNMGLHSFSADLKTPEQGGAALTSYTNRSPNGTWDVNTNDPNYNPDASYPTIYGGFNAVRGQNIATGVVSGAYDTAKGSSALKIYGFGQQTGNMNDYYPPPAHVAPDFKPVAYMPYLPLANTDVAYGTTRADLPQGSLRLSTGTWVGPIAPSFDTTSPDNKTVLWTGTTNQFLIVFPQLQTVDHCAVVPEPEAALLLLAPSLWIVRRARRARV